MACQLDGQAFLTTQLSSMYLQSVGYKTKALATDDRPTSRLAEQRLQVSAFKMDVLTHLLDFHTVFCSQTMPTRECSEHDLIPRGLGISMR